MATYYVWNGATGGTNTGGSWTNAYLTFAQAVTAATANGDFIYVHYTHLDEIGAGTTYTFANNVRVISVNKDSNDTPTVMGTSAWIGSSTAQRSITLAGGYNVYFYGMTFRTADWLQFGATDSSHYEFESCYMWNSGPISGNYPSSMRFGGASNSYIKFINTTFRFSQSTQNFCIRQSRLEFEVCNISTAGSAPTTLFDDNFEGNTQIESAPNVNLVGCDFSHVTGTLVGNFNGSPKTFVFSQCKFGNGVTVLAAQTPANKGSGVVWLFDCSNTDTHGIFGYYDSFGSCVSDTGIYFTSGVAGQSWKIVTTANCSYYTPFVTPFVDWYNNSTTTITPYFEILRDGSTTPLQNDEVWGDFFAKTTSGSTQSTEYSDRMTLLGTPANQTAGGGTDLWTGKGASAWSGKIDSGVSVIPAEVGHIRGRVCVGEPSITVYVDPQIRI